MKKLHTEGTRRKVLGARMMDDGLWVTEGHLIETHESRGIRPCPLAPCLETPGVSFFDEGWGR